jgi:D-alanine transaminase
MERIAYLNGQFVPMDKAQISILDRGFLLADGIYEYTAVLDGKLIDHVSHLQRLERSLREIGLSSPVPISKFPDLQLDLARRNELREGGIYVQISRGVAERDFAFPTNPEPTLIMFTQSFNVLDNPAVRNGISVITVPDIRWRRRDIKSIALLGQVLAKQQAVEAGADDAWMVENGLVTEGASATAYIVSADNRIVTRPLSNDILPGVTRKALIKVADEHGLTIEERAFSVDEAILANEAFISGATTFVTAVVNIDGHIIGEGKPGPVSGRLRELYVAMALGGAYGPE